jgi:hypothetical protein
MPTSCKDFVDYTAVAALKEIGNQVSTAQHLRVLQFLGSTNTSTPSNKQTALQENESTNYVIGAMSDNLDYDALPSL